MSSPVSLSRVESYWDRISPMLTDYGVRVGGAVVLLLLAWFASGYLARWMRVSLEKKHVEMTLARFLSKIVRWLLLIASVLACLSIFGVNITSFAAVLASAGLAVGLALQGSLSNLAAGAALSILRPFKIGDSVVVAGQRGMVDDIDLFATHLDTPDNRRIIIPNNQIFGTIIENITYHPLRRVEVDVGVEYGADIDRTRAVLEQAARGSRGVTAERPAEIELIRLGASSVDWQVRAWVARDDMPGARHELIRAVKQALDRERIGIPFPQMVVHSPR
jgi:small conductance mechanosensitive channel